MRLLFGIIGLCHLARMNMLFLHGHINIAMYNFNLFSIFIFLFYFRERACTLARERGRETGRERILTRLRTNCEIMTWAEIKSWTPNRLSHPSILKFNLNKFNLFKLNLIYFSKFNRCEIDLTAILILFFKLFLFLKNVYLFILRERGRMWVGERQKERGEKENPKQALCCQCRDRHRA